MNIIQKKFKCTRKWKLNNYKWGGREEDDGLYGI